jgi:MFS family permease
MPGLREIAKGNLGIMTLSAGIWTFAGQLNMPFQALYILHLGGTVFHIGLIAAISAITRIIPTLIGGQLADTHGRKKIIIITCFMMSFNALVYAFARDIRWLILASMISALAHGLREPAFASLIADSTVRKSRAQSYAMWSIIPPLFGVASPYIMGTLMDRHGFLPMIRIGYLLLFVAATTASIIRYYYLEETLPATGPTKIGIKELTRDTLTGIRETLATLPRTLKVLGVMGALFGLGAAIGQPYWVIYATEDVINLSLSQWGLIAAVKTITATLVGFPLARISDRRGRRFLLIPCLVITPLAIVGFINSRTFIQTLLVTILITVLGSMGMSSGQALFADLTEPQHRGRVTAFWSITGTMRSFNLRASPGSLIGAAGNLLGGYLYGNHHRSTPLYLQGLMVGLAAVVGLLYLKEPKKVSAIPVED